VKRYLKLVHFEIHRFRYLLASLMALVLVSQFGAMIVYVRNAVAAWERAAAIGTAYRSENLTFVGFIFGTQKLFVFPIMMAIAVLVLYVFFIWYRDWLGRSTFVYRLLTLPVARRHMYLSKLTALLLFVFGLLSYQLGLLALERIAFRLLVPAELYAWTPFSDAIAANQAFALLYPRHPIDFALRYGAGVAGVIVAFTAVLLERSYRGVGSVYAALYAVGCAAAVVGPLFVWALGDERVALYPYEIAALTLGLGAIVAAGSLWLGFRLLDKKITV